jgi:hypothetical protein
MSGCGRDFPAVFVPAHDSRSSAVSVDVAHLGRHLIATKAGIAHDMMLTPLLEIV